MRVIETTLDDDLSVFSRYLWQQRVPHRIFEERGMQVVEVTDAAQSDTVSGAYQAWKSGSLQLRALPQPAAVRARGDWRRALLRYPGLTLLITLACAAFPFSLPLADGHLSEIGRWLTIVDPQRAPPTLWALLAEGRIWRWFTPVLLHFSVLHLAFNCAVTIELGRRVEGELRASGFWLVVLTLSVVSNLGQYASGAGPLFGGLSGVAYGLLGFVLVMARRRPGVFAWRLPQGVALGLLAFLVLFSTGVTESFGLFVANAAHWFGLAAGAGLALLWPVAPGERAPP